MCVCRSHQLHSQQTQCPLSWAQHNLTSLVPEGQKPHSTPPKSTCTQRTFTHLLQALTALSSHTWGLPHVALQYHSCAYLQLPTAPCPGMASYLTTAWHGGSDSATAGCHPGPAPLRSCGDRPLAGEAQHCTPNLRAAAPSHLPV